MKTTIRPAKNSVRVVPGILLFLLITALQAHASTAVSLQPPSDTITVEKTVISKKYRIKLYPNANHQVLFFSASGAEGKIFQLFLFDLAGNLVKQANIVNKQTTVLNKIEKGSYVFEVFSDDERIEHGQLTVH